YDAQLALYKSARADLYRLAHEYVEAAHQYESAIAAWEDTNKSTPSDLARANYGRALALSAISQSASLSRQLKDAPSQTQANFEKALSVLGQENLPSGADGSSQAKRLEMIRLRGNVGKDYADFLWSNGELIKAIGHRANAFFDLNQSLKT